MNLFSDIRLRIIAFLLVLCGIVGITLYIKHLKIAIADEQRNVAAVQQKLYAANAQIVSEREKFKFTVDTMQNEYDSLKRETAALQHRISASDKKRIIIQREYDQRINKILQEPRPKNCNDAVKYLFDSSKELGWTQ